MTKCQLYGVESGGVGKIWCGSCRHDNHILKFVRELHKGNKEGFGASERVLADETGKDR